jgi:hypothetical protein
LTRRRRRRREIDGVRITTLLEKIRRPTAPKVAPILLADPLREHTDGGHAIWYGLTAIATDRSLDPSIRAAAREVRSAIGPKPPSGTLRAAERVAEAGEVRGRVHGVPNALGQLPRTPGGQTYAEAIEAWCNLGEGLTDEVIGGAVARSRAKRSPAAGREVGRLVGKLNAILVHARTALRDEIEYSDELSPTLEAELFGLYDSLLEARQARADQKARRQGRGSGSEASAEPGAAPAAESPSPASP